mgnify:FL=1
MDVLHLHLTGQEMILYIVYGVLRQSTKFHWSEVVAICGVILFQSAWTVVEWSIQQWQL